MKDIGCRIKELRSALSLTQQDFANKLGTSRSNVASYEIGKNVPSDAVTSLICKTFNVDEIWLRTGEGEMFRQLSRNEEIAQIVESALTDESDSFRSQLISVLAALSPDEIEALAKIARNLAQKMDEDAEIKAETEDYARQLKEEKKDKISQASPGMRDGTETA